MSAAPKRRGRSKKKGLQDLSPEMKEQLRAGMPAKDSVREVVDFVAPDKVHYKILKTNEMDAYDIAQKPKRKHQRGRRGK